MKTSEASAGTEGTRAGATETRREMWWAMALAGAAALAAIAPRLGGLTVTDDLGFFARNAGPVVLAFVAAYFVWRRRVRGRALAAIAGAFAAAALFANVYPFEAGGATETLTAWHLPLGLWVVIGVAHAGGAWRTHEAWMSYFRHTGEWVLYMSLFAAGAWLLRVFTFAAFASLDFDVSAIVDGWVLPSVAAGAAVIAAWLVDADHGKLSHLGPVLYRAFIPLMTLVLFFYVSAIVFTRTRLTLEGDALAGNIALLLLVTAVVVYAIAARQGSERVQVIDRIQFALVIIAWGLAGIVFASNLACIHMNGATAPAVAGLVASVVVFANFTWTSWVGHVMLHNNCLFERLDKFQTRFVPVYAVWSAIVVIAFPPMFGFA